MSGADEQIEAWRRSGLPLEPWQERFVEDYRRHEELRQEAYISDREELKVLVARLVVLVERICGQ